MGSDDDEVADGEAGCWGKLTHDCVLTGCRNACTAECWRMDSSSSSSSSSRVFRRLAIATTTLTYFLISVGSIVRVSGAGMGCPDWPRCFGLLVPPTSVDELPPLGTYTYPKGWSVESFDPLMTWIEFTNRLIGATVGIAILATLISAIVSHRRERGVVVPAFIAFVGVLFAAWLGGRVVAHELAPWMVTAHLLSAIVVVSALVVAVVNVTPASVTPPSPMSLTLSRAAWAVGLLALVQGTVGTQVRGYLDDIGRHHPELARGDRLPLVGAINLIHRNLALAVAVAVVILAVLVRERVKENARAQRAAMAAVVCVVAQVVVGVGLAWAGLPHALQVLHLLFGSLLLGALTATAMDLRR